MGIFITDETTDFVQSRLGVITSVSRFKRYEIDMHTGTAYIVGRQSETGFLFENVNINTSEVLFRLMVLYNNLSDAKKIHGRNFQQKINKAVTPADLELILKFCKKNGLPFWNWAGTDNVYENSIPHDLPQQYQNTNCFCVASFIAALYTLHRDFIEVVSYLDLADDPNCDRVLSDADKKELRQMQKPDKPYMYTPTRAPFTTYWNDEKCCLEMKTNNLMHSAVYGLSVIAMGKGVSGYVKVCPHCNQIFVTKESRQKFCNNPCTRQMHYNSEKRKQGVM